MNKREGYVNLKLDEMDETQEMVVNMFINEGQLREQDAIWELLSKNYPSLLGPEEYDRGFEDGYDRALEVLQEYINGPAEAKPVTLQELHEEFDITDVDDPE